MVVRRPFARNHTLRAYNHALTAPLTQPAVSPPIRVDAPADPRRVCVIVPAYREAENLPELIQRLGALRAAPHNLDLDLIIVNDDSGDNSEYAVAQTNQPWARISTRTTERGLSSAVLHGLKLAQHPYLAVMDADLSHPPEAIPRLIAALEEGADFAVGSRYVPGGSTDDKWTLFRAVNSRVATALARPLTNLKDPMSGFFALRRDTFNAAATLNPVGYKIGLELLIKCRCRTIAEVPIHFASRVRGESKLTFKEQLRYLQHLGRLMKFKLRRRK
jgi:dolichol-phosphate mannosyltransferase